MADHASLYAKIAGLELVVEGCALRGLESVTPGGWVRRTTVVELLGQGVVGQGEDVTYDAEEQLRVQGREAPALSGRFSFDSFSHRLDELNLFDVPPADDKSPLFRRWAFESAALDLALRQAGVSLAQRLERPAGAVRYVVSLGLGDPPRPGPLEELWSLYPELGVKLDPNQAWDPALVAWLAKSDRVRTIDLKGRYHGPFEGTPPDGPLYRRLIEGLPGVWLEDPGLNEQTRAVLAGCEDRISYDAPISSLADIVKLRPAAVNMKPSRFGLVSALFRAYDWLEAVGLPAYGGGQFELGPGRRQIQILASLFHPDAPNDVAPSGFNARPLAADLPPSPLPAPSSPGF